MDWSPTKPTFCDGHRVNESRAILIVDLAYGDCGKGTIADFLARHTSAHAVVRFNGGPQAAHHVVTPDGRHHAFARFGSGAFIPGVRTFLSRFMLIEPYALLNEANQLRAPVAITSDGPTRERKTGRANTVHLRKNLTQRRRDAEKKWMT
jgi:adenylosuccinate synthase